MNLAPFLLVAFAALFLSPSAGQNSLLTALALRRRNGYRYPYSYYYPNYYGQGQGGAPPPADQGPPSSDQDQSQNPEEQTSLCNGEPVKSSGGECNFDEAASITVDGAAGITVICNAALTKAKVGGVMKATFVTSALCASAVDQLVKDSDSGLKLRLGSKAIGLDKPIETKQGPNGAAFLDLPENSPILAGLDQCEKPSCAFKSDTMEGKVDMSQCKMISHGATDGADNKGAKREAVLQEKPNGCSEIPDLFGAANTICMESEDTFCSGDNGAPIYCKAPTSDEWILVGITAAQTSCGENSEVKVIPVPT